MMDIDKLIDDILTCINGQRAWDWVARISQYNRIQASQGYHEILEIIKKELYSIGFEEVEHFQSPADGKTKTWDYTAAYQWELEEGLLEIIKPEKVKLCDSNEIPTSIITHSKPCDIIAEVIDIGKGDKEEDYQKEDLEGKIALISSSTYMYRSIIEKSNAVGVIFYPDLKRTGDQTDKRIYNSFFTTEDRINNAKFGFSISYGQAIYLKELIEKGPIKVHAKIDAKFIEGNLEVLSTTIKGSDTPDKEIIIIAHLCHPNPGANDNASGAAGLLELARSLKSLCDRKILITPKYTIRFIWVPEFNGTIPWMKHHEEKVKSAMGCLNLDMIGEHRLKIGYPLQINLAPHSTPSILNDITSMIVKKIVDHPKGVSINGTKVPMSYRLTGFEGGSDHVVFADFYFGIPSLMFGHDDPYYHSSMDTVEFCDSTELKRVIAMALSISYILAIMDNNVISDLVPIIHQGVLSRCSKAVKLLEDLINQLKRIKGNNLEKKAGEKILLGTDIFKAFYDYEINLFKWLKRIDNSQDIDTLSEFIEKEISIMIQFQKERWDIITKQELDEKSIKLLKSKYATTFKPSFKGPFLVDRLFELHQINEFQQLCDDLKYGYLGPIDELINLSSKGYEVLRIASYLSLEYDTIILPSKVLTLLEYLLKMKIITQINS
jgi:aminopeptidase-like protein